MDEYGKAIAEGHTSFSTALDTLMSAHVRLFGYPPTPGSARRLEERMTERLIEVTTAAETLLERRGVVRRAVDRVHQMVKPVYRGRPDELER